ncbi:MAG: hypothetical protein OSB69_18485 [Alphaproteobacteria bacterium]|nr:hypothetical protein [Alphaproteobacteria bacterium]
MTTAWWIAMWRRILYNLPRADLTKAWKIRARVCTEVGANKIDKRNTKEDLWAIN